MKSPSLYTHGAFTGQQVKGLHFSFFFVNSRVSGGLLSEAAYDHYKRTKKTEQTQNDGREGQIKEEKFEEREGQAQRHSLDAVGHGALNTIFTSPRIGAWLLSEKDESSRLCNPSNHFHHHQAPLPIRAPMHSIPEYD